MPLRFASLLRHTRRFALLVVVFGSALSLSAADKRVLLIAGTPSHGPGMHEPEVAILGV